MSNETNAAEPSGASAGSQPVLWALEWKEDAGSIDPEWVYDTHEEAVDVNETGCYGRATVVPLYRSPALTDSERFVLREVRDIYADEDDVKCNEIAAVIDGLLERTK